VKHEALRELADTVSGSGLIKGSGSAVVMVSGGADSACTAAGLIGALGAESVHALHVNYRLRAGAAEGEAAARQLCAALRVDLHIERPDEPLEGNLQSAARKLRYEAAEKLRRRTGSDLIVTGHTRTDMVETLIYRLATSPGTRALLGLAPRSGRVIRPLLKLERERVRELAEGAGLPFADDETNAMPVFARNRIRSEVLPLMRELNPAAIRNVAETRAELAEEAALLERVVLEALEDVGCGAGALSVDGEALLDFEPGMQRLALRALAERATGRTVPLGRARAAEIVRIAGHPEGGEVQLGDGVVAVCEAGYVCFRTPMGDAAPEPVTLTLPGRVRLGEWEVQAELRPGPLEPAGPELATLDAAAVRNRAIEVRTWRPGDRIRPLGMEGTKTLQDLFTDRHVPRSRRHEIPIVTVAGAIAWVAGVAVSEDFRLARSAERVAVLTARQVA
jgi:tRNA(Ile)-lysidine synthase